MNQRDIKRIALLIAGAVYLVAIIGQAFAIPFLASWDPSRPGMQPLTSITGILILISIWHLNSSNCYVEAMVGSCAIMSTLVILDKVLMPDTGQIERFPPGTPSVGALAGFLFLLMGMGSCIAHKPLLRDICCTAAAVIALLALYGHVTEQASFYYEIPGKSPAMSIPTATGLLFSTIGLLLWTPRPENTEAITEWT